jgi:probable F420-dependent oxidoreductase
MRIGVVFPQTDIGNDPVGIRDYAQAVEAMGYAHILAYDHVLGANADRPGGSAGPYTARDAFHEPFVLFGYLAAVTRRIELATGVIILPQRQTALVAKQAAAVDVLCGGRLRLGVGIGWNAVEYEALGEDFTNRGRRSEEQLEVLRALWTRPLVTYAGRWHRIQDAGLNPLPVQRPIPLWLGGKAEPVLERAARLADGWTWMSHVRPDAEARALAERVRQAVVRAGRDPARFGLEGRVTLARLDPGTWAGEVAAWRAVPGVTHLCVDTLRLGLAKPDQHIDLLRRFKEAALG